MPWTRNDVYVRPQFCFNQFIFGVLLGCTEVLRDENTWLRGASGKQYKSIPVLPKTNPFGFFSRNTIYGKVSTFYDSPPKTIFLMFYYSDLLHGGSCRESKSWATVLCKATERAGGHFRNEKGLVLPILLAPIDEFENLKCLRLLILF